MAADKYPENKMLMICHAAGYLGFIFPFGGNVLGPLIVWKTKREDYPLLETHGKAAVNFQLSIFIYILICLPFTLIFVGIVGIVLLLVCQALFSFLAILAAHDKELYEYPLSLNLIK